MKRAGAEQNDDVDAETPGTDIGTQSSHQPSAISHRQSELAELAETSALEDSDLSKFLCLVGAEPERM